MVFRSGNGGVPLYSPPLQDCYVSVMEIKGNFDHETKVTTNGNRIISKMFHSCALNK